MLLSRTPVVRYLSTGLVGGVFVGESITGPGGTCLIVAKGAVVGGRQCVSYPLERLLFPKSGAGVLVVHVGRRIGVTCSVTGFHGGRSCVVEG